MLPAPEAWRLDVNRIGHRRDAAYRQRSLRPRHPERPQHIAFVPYFAIAGEGREQGAVASDRLDGVQAVADAG